MKAILIGATGLVGTEIAKILLDDQRFSEVRILARRSSGLSHPKLQEMLIDFDKPLSWAADIVGDVLFSALGTTLKQAGSKAVQYHVDHDYQFEIAKAAKANGVQRCILVSSKGANSRSPFFYMRMKGEIENHVAQLGFEAAYFVRPGPLDGRKSPTLSEKLMLYGLNALPKFQGGESYWPIQGKDVARVCVECAFDARSGTLILEPKEIFSRLNTYHKEHSHRSAL